MILNFAEELKLDLNKNYSIILEEIETSKSYVKIKDHFERFKTEFEQSLTNIDKKIEGEITIILEKSEEAKKLSSELQELKVKFKNQVLQEYEITQEKLDKKIELLKNDLLQGNLLALINDSKIHLSQLLGTLQRRVEDNIEIKEFKRAQDIVQKRIKNVNLDLKNIQKRIKNKVKEYSKQSVGFKSKNKYILENFDQFLIEYDAILVEKVKTLERNILKDYVLMTIHAVSNQYLTIGFLNHELKIKKQNIQDHLLYLISTEQLQGKYDPRLGLYYENPEVLRNLNENELEVIKKMNFRVYMFLNRLKNFTSQYYSIIAFFASTLTISYYLFTLSGGNPLAIFIPLSILVILLSYMFFKKRREKI